MTLNKSKTLPDETRRARAVGHLRAHWRHFQLLMVGVEVAVSGLLFLLLLAWQRVPLATGHPRGVLLALGAVACGAWPLALYLLEFNASQRRRPISSILARLFFAGIACTLVLATTAFLVSAPVARLFPIVYGTAQFALLAFLRVGVLAGLRQLRRRGRNYRNILVVGSGPRARAVQRSIENHPSWGIRIVGFVDEYEAPLDPDRPPVEVHKYGDLPALFGEYVIDEVIVAVPRSMLGGIGPVVEACSAVGVPVTIPSDLFGDLFPPPRVTHFNSMAALSYAPVHHGSVGLALKRGMDIVGASAALVLTAPLIALVAMLICATSPGQVFFRQIRLGLNGRPFSLLKFRTMCVDADAHKSELLDRNEMDGPVFKIRNDPRVTAVGRFLRRWSIDEFPQFWNVLRGEMSLVGPRPPVPEEVAHYETVQRRRLSMRPGITCLWQVNGRNQIDFGRWVKLDLEYIDTWSLGNDLKILLRTIPAVIRGNGAS